MVTVVPVMEQAPPAVITAVVLALRLPSRRTSSYRPALPGAPGVKVTVGVSFVAVVDWLARVAAL